VATGAQAGSACSDCCMVGHWNPRRRGQRRGAFSVGPNVLENNHNKNNIIRCQALWDDIAVNDIIEYNDSKQLEAAMASMTIRDIDDRLKARLRLRAAHHGHSMEEEAREILRTALSTPRSQHGSLADCIRARIEPLGGFELKTAPREPIREPADLDT